MLDLKANRFVLKANRAVLIVCPAWLPCVVLNGGHEGTLLVFLSPLGPDMSDGVLLYGCCAVARIRLVTVCGHRCLALDVTLGTTHR